MLPELTHYLNLLRDKGITFRLSDGELKFQAPKGVVDSDMLHELRARKQEILDFLAVRSLESTHAPVSPFRIKAAERPEHLPLSYSQERLWFLEQLDLVKSAYHVPGMVRLNGELDDAALERSLMTIVARHESLRTRFEQFEGRGVQRVVDVADALRLQREDFSHLPELERAAQVERLTNFALEEPFDLRTGPLLRVRLIRLAAKEHLLLLTMHHIVCDGWSIGVLVRELSELYTAYVQGLESPLAPLPIQYADYALWQREWLQGEVLETQLDYWKERLSGAPPALSLPTDRARPAVASYRGSNLPFAVSAQVMERLNALARAEGATLFMVLLGAFQLALSRWSGQDDIIVGAPITGRRQQELDGLIGFFVNTLVFRTDLSGRPTFRALLARVRETALGAYAHQDVPFEKLVEALHPERDLGRHPIFQTWLVVEGPGQDVVDFRLPQLEVSGVQVKQVGAKFDLYLSLRETRDGLVGTLDFATDLFEHATMHRFARGLERLLDQIAAHPDWHLFEFTMLSDDEREQQLLTWNATAQPAANLTLPQMLEDRARGCGDSTALRFEGQALDYAALAGSANRLAHHLIGLGVGPERRVALALPRSFELVVAMLAIVKSGAAYVPIDTDYPSDRIEYMLHDCAAACILTQTSVLHTLPHTGNCPVLCLDDATLLADMSALPGTDPTDDQRTTPLLPQHPAYMIYTSGSTGRPKGVINTHAGIINRLQWMQAAYRLTAADRVLQKTPISFDVSVWEFFWPLLQGATLVLAAPEGHRDPDYISGVIAREGITIAHFVPAMLDAFLREPRARECASLRAVISSGESLTRMTQRRFEETVGATLHNLYGPTEAAVDVTAWTCSPDDDTRDVPIGRPIWNTQMRVLDRDLQLLPTGAVGELYIAGAGLARGYATQPGLTADRFVADPFGAPGSRIYRTGDLARWRVDGALEYLGRADTQIKLRGIRVELGEIETALASHPGVREACVALRKDRGEARLIAYVIACDEAPMPGELREHLSQVLPEYMLPAAFVFVSEFPVSPSGKLDRNALPAPDAGSFVSREYEAPQSEAEIAIAAVWSPLLSIERIGRQDNFFALGGHSLLAIRFVERMREQGFKITARDLFTAPTLAQLAARAQPYVEEDLPDSVHIPEGAVAITPQMLPLTQLTPLDIERIVEATPGGAGTIKDVYPLTPLQEGILFHHLISDAGDPYVLTNLFAFDSSERMQAHLDALQVVMDRHDILRTALMWEGLPEPVQIVWRHAPLLVQGVALDVERDAAEQLLQIGDPTTFRMDLRRAPLMRAFSAYDQVSGRWMVLLAVHHVIADHTTIEMLQLEIRHTLDDTLAQLPPPLPFRTLVARTRDVARQEQHETFFRRLLGDFSEATAAYGVVEVHNGVGSTRTIERALGATVAGRLRDRARHSSLSAASLFHLAWALVLARVSGTEDVVFGTVLFGRLHGQVGIERILGPVINTLPVRVTVSAASVEQAWRQVHELLAELVEHDDASLTLAQRCSGIPAPQPLFYALLNFRYGGALTTHADVKFDEVELLSVAHSTNYPLVLCVDDLGTGYDLTVSGQGGIDPARVCDYLAHALNLLLDAMDHDQPVRLSDIDVMPMEETRALTARGAARCNHSNTRCVHHWFADQAKATPDSIAVVDAERRLSYAELNVRANRLAHRLRGLGVKAEDRVAICMERCAELIIAVLATVKAGAAYVPLDPSYPSDRLVYMLTDCRPAAVLTQPGLGSNWTEALASLPPGTAMLHVTDAACAWDEESSENIDDAVGVHARSLLYIIYTSGSTGAPKGVMIEHGNLTRLFSATESSFAFSHDDVWTFFHSIAFDFSVWEIWGALLYGGRVVVVPHAIARSTDEFYQLICREQVTVLNQTPSAFRQLIAEQARVPQRHALRSVIFGGEALDARALAPWYADQRNAATSLVNMYGITETTVHVTYRPLSPVDSRACGASPIGTPIEDLSLHILDSNGRVAPDGVVGEIFVGGAGVARGYLNREDLTAARFLRNHLGDDSHARLYKTGDLGRRRDDGQVDYIGRNDAQVKIRGFRIELGEIESALTSHPGVQDAVVLTRQASTGDKQLHAYYVAATAEGSDEPSPSDLRRHVSAYLPDYMLPSVFIRLERLPLTPNGKLDHKAMLAVDAETHTDTEYVAPVGTIEVALSEIWQSLLGRGAVGRNDNFFDLGGHSLLAMQFTSRIRERLGVEIGLRELFLHPLLKDLAAVVAEAAPSGLPDVVPLRHDGAVALSFAQQRLWFLAELEADSSAYHIISAFRLRGELDQNALRAALDGLLARHDILRTTFQSCDGEPAQSIAPVGAAFSLERHDLRNCPAPTAELNRILQEESTAPFDLTQGPLIRARLVHTGDGEHVMMVTMHHIVSDGWSMQILIDDFARLYARARDGAASPLAPLALQYADFAVWQRTWIAGEVLQEQADYWRDLFAIPPPFLELPADRHRPAQQDYSGSRVPYRIDRELTARLKRAAREQGVSVFALLFAGWAALLARLSGQEDIVIGTPSANRGRRELEDVIGFFVNTLAVRVALDGAATVHELVEHVQARLLDAQAHQDVPFEQVIEMLRPPRSLAHTPLFQAMFTWQNAVTRPLELSGLEVSAFETGANATAKFDVSLSLGEVGDEIAGELEYATALYDLDTIERYLTYFGNLLAAMTDDAEQPWATLDLLPLTERRTLLTDWAGERKPGDDATLPDLIETCARGCGTATALRFEGVTLAYAQLSARANQLARHLITLGIGPEQNVALALPRSFDLVVAMLAISKSGAAYVPIDTAYPLDRIAYMLGDCAPTCIVTQTDALPFLPNIGACPVLCLDDPTLRELLALLRDSDPIDAERTTPLLALHPAYMIYTSGTTGRPKGVINTHAGIVNRLRWMQSEYGLTATDRVLQKTPVSFDVSVWEFFWPLLHGATLVLARPEGHKDPDYIGALIASEGITIVHFVPAMLDEFLREPRTHQCASLRAVICSGEALSRTTQHRFHAMTGAELHNLYGPTEAAVDVTAWACTQDEDARDIPIGRPIWNTEMRVLDSSLQLLPIGSVGNLYITGMGLARGYSGRPGLTATCFIADPFGAPGARLYRTGDLARWRVDGALEYLGRADTQVKLRGFRIELGEINAALTLHADIRQALVVLRGSGGDARLVAYLIANEREPTPVELREHLALTLPEHMLPAAFVYLTSFPVSPSGKLDHKRLPEPEVTRSSGRAPRTHQERILCDLFADVLGLSKIGIDESFFELGGHSLLATRLVSRVRGALDKELSVRTLFEAPTVAALAARLMQGSRPGRVPTPIARRPQQIPLSFAQRRLWFVDHLQGPGASYNVPLAVRLSGALNPVALRSAMHDLVIRHEVLRTVYVEHAGVPSQHILAADEVQVPFEQVDCDTDALAEEVARRERECVFDLARDIPLRVWLFRINGTEHVLLVLVHHIAADASSVAPLIHDLSTAYAARLGGAEPDSSPLTLQYADYALWQREALGDESDAASLIAAQLAYWRQALDGLPAQTRLPFDRPHPARWSGRGDSISLDIPASLHERLRALHRSTQTTMFMLLQAAVAVLLFRTGAGPDIVLGTSVAGRSDEALDDLVGCFANLLVLRVQIDGNESFSELLRSVREVNLDAQQHQDLPFERLVELLQPVRTLASHPLFQVAVVMEDDNRQSLDVTLAGLVASPVVLSSATAKYDLQFSFAERFADGEPDGIRVSVIFARDLFDSATVAALTQRLHVTLDAVSSDSGLRVRAFDIMTAEERLEILSAGMA